MHNLCWFQRGSPWTRPATLTLVAMAASLVLTVGRPAAARGEDLERQLLKEAPHVIKYLQDKQYQNVGVLKFRVQKGQGEVTDHAGTLNLTIAQRLEIALILANDVRHPIGIVQNASAVAATLNHASHLTPEGRQALFAGRYPLAWGKQEVTPDAFITGVVQVSPDLKRLTVGLVAFGKEGGGLEKVSQFTAATEPDTLVETGESFLLRGAFDSGQELVVQDKAVAIAAKVKEKEEVHPLQDEAAPIDLQFCYDGKPVDPEIQDGKAVIPEPQEGQKVTLVLKRKPEAKDRYGIVLKVNGENTLYKQRLKDVQCRKWVLDPGDGPMTVTGFQLTDKQAEEFRVLSREESKQKEMYYGADVGTISMTVFREKKDPDKEPAVLKTDEEDLVALSRGVYPKEKPVSLAALQQLLHDDSTRGILGEGNKVAAATQAVKFVPDPTPVMAVTITYYKP